ncbi:hypothetical protein [Burkholderia multivorans]|uniref:hypothetical protein n=1 Tax=Burkholderia multivorans TaxID=87883 RepID=UPI002870984D|nr:hypothetical protein [Burkholderia multivorans]
MQGVYGDGRIIQVPVVERDGGYREAIRRAMRSGADLMMIGEIRSAEPAEEVALASINGQFHHNRRSMVDLWSMQSSAFRPIAKASKMGMSSWRTVWPW